MTKYKFVDYAFGTVLFALAITMIGVTIALVVGTLQGKVTFRRSCCCTESSR
jgi:ABC-type microcin C transport system permease subunit YejE